VRVDELVLKIADDELRVAFHPRMTVLCGLGAAERQELAESILGALTGGAEDTTLRYVDGMGRPVTVSSGPGGSVQARHDDDGSSVPSPIDSLAASPEALRALMLVQAADLGAVVGPARDDEPRDLREARASLEEITEELQAALGEAQEAATLQGELDELDETLRTAHDGAARREYAQVLAQLERVRAEAATLQSGTGGVDADRHLLSHADRTRSLAATWKEAADAMAAAVARFGGAERLHSGDLARAAVVPDVVPADLDARVDALADAAAHRDALDHRLQALAVAKLPAPSDLVVGELGLLEQASLWTAADRLVATTEEVQRVQMSLGGLGGDETSETPAAIEEMEVAHRDLEEAERAAEAVRVPGVAGTALGVTIMLAGTIGGAIWLIPLGMLIGACVGTVTLILPKSRVAKAAAIERTALDKAGVPSYLGFHLRRVDATVDPNVRGTVESSSNDLRSATAAWVALVGAEVDVRRAKELETEVQSYNAALRNLGGAADEIEQLRRDLADHAEPAVADARAALLTVVRPFGLDEADLLDGSGVDDLVAGAIARGQTARTQLELEQAEGAEREAAQRLGEQLLQLGFDSGEVDARVGAVEWALTRAAEREEVRANARPKADIDAELSALQESARALRRPEWSEVTPAEAETLDVEALEERRQKVRAELAVASPEVDVVRLADRQAAVERRVVALEAKHGGHDAAGDPGAVADIQQHLLGRLTKAGTAGPQGDAVPVLLDEVLARVPAERMWDQLDLLYRLSERHQIIYLSDDAFVAAWARQLADGSVMLLEPEPESV
jgi:hypothetical protein